MEGGFFACYLAPLLPDGEVHPDPDRWLSANEILAARGASERWIGHDQLEGPDQGAFARVKERQAANLRGYCADVLRGDWSVFDAARAWLEHPVDA